MTEHTNAQFLRELAHIAEVGDPIEPRDIARLRAIADALAAFETPDPDAG